MRESWGFRTDRSGGGGVRANHSPEAPPTVAQTTDYVFELPWAQRLDLALGACRGLKAFIDALPGYAHNDIKSANFLVDRPRVTPEPQRPHPAVPRRAPRVAAAALHA